MVTNIKITSQTNKKLSAGNKIVVSFLKNEIILHQYGLLMEA